MRVDRCNNIGDFRSMARRRLPGLIFHYIDGAADDPASWKPEGIILSHGRCFESDGSAILRRLFGWVL
jgi:hypothetical protein